MLCNAGRRDKELFGEVEASLAENLYLIQTDPQASMHLSKI